MRALYERFCIVHEAVPTIDLFAGTRASPTRRMLRIALEGDFWDWLSSD